VARRHLDSGRIGEVAQELEKIKETKSQTADRVRALIRDLDRSPLGHHGLAEALQGFIGETAQDSDVRFHTDIADVRLPPPIALLAYHIARESVMNALKHAKANNMWLTLRPDGDAVELILRDDGVGFDADAPAPEGHYGLAMIRERATVGGGTYTLESAPGAGTTITVRFPTSLLQGEAPAPEPTSAGSGTADASHGIHDDSQRTRVPPSQSVPA
jgi:signal transduction histidine kinase